jgi:hypothetical protein
MDQFFTLRHRRAQGKTCLSDPLVNLYRKFKFYHLYYGVDVLYFNIIDVEVYVSYRSTVSVSESVRKFLVHPHTTQI